MKVIFEALLPSEVRLDDEITHWFSTEYKTPNPVRWVVVAIADDGIHAKGCKGKLRIWYPGQPKSSTIRFNVKRPKISDFPGSCTRCGRRAYVSAFSVIHADEAAARGCPALRGETQQRAELPEEDVPF